ncbi:MAG TPA: sulfatase [Bryobacteraceae bacterium]|nr:sulfatase [Bryobacteraceae bacterium]
MRHQFTRRSMLAGLAAPALAHQSSRPNIVFFLSDDHGYRDSSVYGSRVVRTPAMQQLASDGMVFMRAFTGSPTCVPSRAIIMSGLMPARNGALPNHSGLTPGIRTLPTYLKQADYRVAHFGKSHYQPKENYPDLEWVPSEIRRGPLNSDLDTPAVEDWLKRRDASSTRAQPVCMFVNSHSPHVYWAPNEGYDPARVELPPTFVDTPETREERTKYYTDVSLADKQLGEIYSSAKRYLGRNTLFIYTSDNGAQWPFAKWSLYDAGILQPFIAIWPGVIRPGSRANAMISFCDILPTLLVIAGAKAPEDIDGRSFEHVFLGQDRHRTEIYGAHSGDRDFNVFPMRCVRTARHKYILNLHPEFRYTTHIDKAGGRDGRDYFDSWVRKAQSDPAAAAVVRRYHEHPAEELYDVVADPHENRNLAADPKHRRTLENLRQRLRSWMRKQGDEGKVFGNPTKLSRTAQSQI